MNTLTTILAAGGGGGGGTLAKLSTVGGAVYLGHWLATEGHVVLTWILRGRKAAKEVQTDIDKDEFGL